MPSFFPLSPDTVNLPKSTAMASWWTQPPLLRVSLAMFLDFSSPERDSLLEIFLAIPRSAASAAWDPHQHSPGGRLWEGLGEGGMRMVMAADHVHTLS